MVINDKRPTSLQMTDPTTDPLLVPFPSLSIPDPTGLFCKRSTDGKNKLNYWTCTLCGFVNEKCSSALVQHAKTQMHLKAIGAPSPQRNMRTSKGDHAVRKLSSEVPNAAAEALENHPKGEKTPNESMKEAEFQEPNANTSVSTSERADNEKVSAQVLGNQNPAAETLGNSSKDDGKNEIEAKNKTETETQILANPSGNVLERVSNHNTAAETLGNSSTDGKTENESMQEGAIQVPNAAPTEIASERNARNEPVEEETCFEENRARAGKYKCFRNFNLLCDPTKALKKEEGMDEDDDMDTSSDDDDAPLRKRFKPMTR